MNHYITMAAVKPLMSSSATGAFHVRAATSQDLDRLCELADLFLTQIRAEGAARDARRVFERTLKSQNAGVIIVAEHRGGLCGYAYAEYQWRAEFGGETMDIVEMFVEPQWRNKGVGGTMTTQLLKNARQRGIRRVHAEVHPGNSAIEHTLESSGFDPERRTLWGIRL
ncbi:MAG: GNAT family N-acetyltransferase [Acidobacteria bacterium]|nr:GNAT family N-acetyltransferase [Acidobacteriota bacterium]